MPTTARGLARTVTIELGAVESFFSRGKIALITRVARSLVTIFGVRNHVLDGRTDMNTMD